MVVEKVIVYNNGVVIVERDVFEAMLMGMSKKDLISMFACDIATQEKWKKESKPFIERAILIEYEA